MRSLLRLAAAFLALVGSSSQAASLGKECNSNSDCADGATCVAGDSVTSVQRCVAGTVCGGSVLGACPGDEISGQLACIWREDAQTCASSPSGCAEIGGALGIYKCISLDRCDEYFAGQCSGKCNVNGKQCNGRGTCLFTGSSGAKPTFGCACDSGWNGTLCNNVVDDTCIEDVGQCGDHGTCVGNSCSCKNGYTGDQCQIAPATNVSSSGSDSGSGSGGSITTKSPSSSTTSPSTTSGPSTAASKANATDTISKDSSGPSALVIVMAVLVALIIVGAILFVFIARKRRREQEALEAGGAFNRTDSVVAAVEGARPPTPKQKIVIM